MINRSSLENQVKKLALGWTLAGLVITLGIALAMAFFLPLRDAENRIRTYSLAVTASHRNQILSGDIRTSELQIRNELGLTAAEKLFFLDPDKNRWLKDTRAPDLQMCSSIDEVCYDPFIHKLVSYTPIFFGTDGTSKWGYLYIERNLEINWQLFVWIIFSVAVGMSVQTVGFYIGLTKAMRSVGKALKDWSNKLSLNPKNKKNYKTAPFSEIAPIEAALGGLCKEIDSLEEIARTEGALSTLRGIGHDILNPVSRMKRILGIIDDANAEILEVDRELFQSLSANVKRLSLYAEQLKFIYRRHTEDVDEIQVSTNVSDEISNLTRELKFDPEVIDKEISIETELTGGISSAIPAAALGRMVENLLSNGVQASSRGGTVSICVVATGKLVQISVSDNGHGIPDDIRSKVFEAGFTSRANRGTGLGLFVVKQICEQYGGRLRLKSEVNRGTEISIELPRQEVLNGI